VTAAKKSSETIGPDGTWGNVKLTPTEQCRQRTSFFRRPRPSAVRAPAAERVGGRVRVDDCVVQDPRSSAAGTACRRINVENSSLSALRRCF